MVGRHLTEKEMVAHSRRKWQLWKIPWMEEPGRLQSMGSWRVGHYWVTSLSLSCIGEGNGNALQHSCLENPRDRGAWWLPSMGSHRVRHNWSDLAAAAADILLCLSFGLAWVYKGLSFTYLLISIESYYFHPQVEKLCSKIIIVSPL